MRAARFGPAGHTSERAPPAAPRAFFPAGSLDALAPAAMARHAETVGETKAATQTGDADRSFGSRRRVYRANMYFVPTGILIRGDAGFIATTTGLGDLSDLTWGSFFLDNLLPVTIGNLIGGTILVGALYWFVYLRPGQPAPDVDQPVGLPGRVHRND